MLLGGGGAGVALGMIVEDAVSKTRNGMLQVFDPYRTSISSVPHRSISNIANCIPLTKYDTFINYRITENSMRIFRIDDFEESPKASTGI